ncbi:sigma-70 region 2 [Leptospira inadai serovar Lyme str. 10]|uniref:Sigma-70 region 2 n=2 Tax=Leptospira inadai serovar Lyme TaxID=293084 RepID=V6HCP3_9LEPT|nr:sigma-70 family RNA polymerase sigma factor [Leptospira inadai]EQA36678.1 sigma-70 region 2 [Leptospira inadai serovar Lyme str. 10]PNV74494.1 RNA polymerase subunit sigma [Leptospira inadai serovar Lyme]
MDRLGQFLENKKLVFGIAYRMTGSVVEAEDIVQETFLRWEKSGKTNVRSPKAFLSTVATRLSLDSLRKSKRKRETYIGPWLPEPLSPIPFDQEIQADEETLDLAFLHILEKLNPIERATFLLRESFDLDYSIIADAVGKSPENCRQIFKRAKEALKSDRKRFSADPETRRLHLRNFLLASSKSDPNQLIPFLKEEIVMWSDGGGKVNAARIPILGRERVASVLNRVRRNRLRKNLRFYFSFVNGAETIVGYHKDQPVFLQNFLIESEGIWRIYSVLNPDKLLAFKDKEKLSKEGSLIPIESFLLFPNSPKASLPKWISPIAKLVGWVIS